LIALFAIVLVPHVALVLLHIFVITNKKTCFYPFFSGENESRK